jgi:diguanylate cyclase (GGDEF)-like protein
VRVRSVVCVPGIVGDEVFVLCYAYRAGPEARPFEDHAVHLAVAVCHQAALTVQRELLLERTRHLERLASTDSLTGLNNRRHFLEMAEQEFQRARRYKRPLAVLMLDINDFKHFNHRYGHSVGDLLLRAVATSCRENLREPHLVARYGGDEFVVMLLECNRETGQVVAHRLRDKTAGLAIETPAGTLRVRLDAGCAALTPEIPDLASLIDLAIADAAAARHEAQAASYRPEPEAHRPGPQD